MSPSPSPSVSSRAPDSGDALAPHDVANAALSDRALRRRSRRYGNASRRLRRQFLATLVEIDRRHLARKHGGIYAYAARVGSASANEVRETLSLAQRLEGLPGIWRLFETGEVARQTIRRVPVEFLHEAPEAWAGHLLRLSRQEVIELVRAERDRRAPMEAPERGASLPTSRDPEDLPGQGLLPGVPTGEVGAGGAASWTGPVGSSPSATGSASTSSSDIEVWSGPNTPPLLEPISWDPSAPSPDARTFELKLQFTADEYARLLVLVQSRTKEAGRPLARAEVVKEVLLEAALDARPGGSVDPTPAERRRLRERAIEAAREATGKVAPRPVLRDVSLRSGGTCELGRCVRPGEHFHHRIPWRARREHLPASLRDLPRHHPDAIVHLCSIHHGLVHGGRIENPFDPPREWRLASATAPDRSDATDRRFQEERSRARGRRAATRSQPERDRDRAVPDDSAAGESETEADRAA